MIIITCNMYIHTPLLLSQHFSESLSSKAFERPSLETPSRHHRKRYEGDHSISHTHTHTHTHTYIHQLRYRRRRLHRSNGSLALYALSSAPYQDDPAPAVHPKQCESTRISPPINSWKEVIPKISLAFPSSVDPSRATRFIVSA